MRLHRSRPPWPVSILDIFRLQPEQVFLKCRDENEGQLIKLLDYLGF